MNTRSITSFNSPLQLRQALQVDDDWKLRKYDASTSNEQSLSAEFERLMVLQSYGVLDTKPELEFEMVTEEAKAFFGVPIAVISLVDLGRQWFKSINGLDVDQTSRQCSFCAHVVQRQEKAGILVVPDATKDERFADNPLVTGAPHIRFYAGAPLKSPEGAILGSFCIIDTQPRPQGLKYHEAERLSIMAHEAVLALIMRDMGPRYVVCPKE